MDISEITSLMKSNAKADIALVTKAFDFAKQAHEGQKRFSGEPYFVHPFTVAKILAESKADAETIAAGLLHDTLEDGHTTKAELEKTFGKSVAFLVDGVSKLGKLKYQGVTRHVESLRKFFVAMAADMRVIIIRLADRLHNIQTLEYVPKEKQRRIAVETLEIYAPLANRLGMWRLKGMLEDGSFPYVFPNEYKKVLALRKTKGKESYKRLEKVHRTLMKEFAARNLKDVEIDYRLKYLYSLYTKLLKNNMDIERIYDISALRVIVATVEECYKALGIIHSIWRPVPGKLKDYIATPKPNGYQSIHTTVFTGDGSVVEIQIRTKEMQREAEYGFFTSHVAYEESDKPRRGGKLSKGIQWIQELIEWQKHVKESDEFLHSLRTDFFEDRIFVFTPKGDVIELPQGATPIDFAYAIHSDIGNHASGARVNGKLIPLDSPLKNGDIVLIETNRKNRPTPKWLDHTRTSGAKKHIKNLLQKERKDL